MVQLPSWAWTSLQIAAACIFLSLVVMVENCDMASLGRQSMFIQHVQRERGHASEDSTHTLATDSNRDTNKARFFKTKAELKQITQI